MPLFVRSKRDDNIKDTKIEHARHIVTCTTNRYPNTIRIHNSANNLIFSNRLIDIGTLIKIKNFQVEEQANLLYIPTIGYIICFVFIIYFILYFIFKNL